MNTLAAKESRWASFAAVVERLSESDFRCEGLCVLMTHGGVLLGPSEYVRENPNLSVTFNVTTNVVELIFDDGSPHVLVKRVDVTAANEAITRFLTKGARWYRGL